MNNVNLQQPMPQAAGSTKVWTSFFAQMNLVRLKNFFLPVSYTLFLLGFFFFPSSTFHCNFFYVAVAFPFLISIFMKKVDLRSLFFNRIFLLSTIFLVYMFSTLFWADNCDLSDISRYGRRVLYVLIFLGVTIHLIQTYPNFLHRLLVTLCWTTAIFAIGYIVFYYTQHPFPNTRLSGFGQLKNPIMASSVYGIVAIVCTYLFQQQRTVKMKLLYLGMLLVFLLYMLLAQSRGPLLACGVTILAWSLIGGFFYKEGDHGYRNNFFLLLIISAAIAAMFILFPDFFKALIFRGTSYRPEIWGQSLLQTKDAPFFGHGLTVDTLLIMSDGTKMLHHHSVYMTTLFYGGIVGLLLLSALAGSAIWQGLTRIEKLQKFLLTCMLLYGIICMVTDGNTLIRHPKPIWLFFWFPIALVAASELPGNSLSSPE
jgi:O-antigen ligase